MTLDTDRIETVTFDSFTTLVDVLSSTHRALSRYVDNPDPIGTIWRERAVEYRMVSNYVDEYERYDRTTREALEYALAKHDVSLDDDEIDDVASVFEELDVFDDVREGMLRLSDAGYDLYVASNGHPELLEAMVSRADVADLLEDTVSADEIQTYKPAESFYAHVADRVDTPIDRVCHVATPWYDIYGAMAAGMQGVWVNRKDDPWEAFDGDPDFVADDLHEVADALGA